MKKNLVSIMKALKIHICQIRIGNHRRKKVRFRALRKKKLLQMRRYIQNKNV